MPENQTYIPILRTKLHKPPAASDILHRQHLLDRLDRHRQNPLTLVSAPAGYGKSSLVGCWLETYDIPSTWISLDLSENDLRAFVAYFVAAVERLFPGACRNTQMMIESPNLPRLAKLSTTILNELDQIEQPFIIVLDDYHLINETLVHDLLTELLNNPPQSLHLVIISRKDLTLPVVSLRAKGLVTEIRTRDLSFTQLETEAFLRLILNAEIESNLAATLREKTEGWVTGLRLATISLRHKDNPDPKLLLAHTGAQYVMEYLFNEAFASQSSAIRQYLLCSAILDRFCAPLCEAVRGPGTKQASCEVGGPDYIAQLRQESLFLIPLDAEDRWFRFHHLFQKLLLDQMNRQYSSEEIKALHTRAGAWFFDEGLITEAIRHTLEAGDEAGAAQIVVQHRDAALNSERWFELEKWLSMLPQSTVRQRPELLLAQASVYYYHYELSAIPPIIDAVESLLSHRPEESTLYGEISFFKSLSHFYKGEGALSFKFAEDALKLIPESHHYMRGRVEVHLALTSPFQGQADRVEKLLMGLLNERPLADRRKIRLMNGLTWMYIRSGDLSAAFEMAQRLKTFVTRAGSTFHTAQSLFELGLIHYCRNELAPAVERMRQALELRSVMYDWMCVDCLAILALSYQAAQQTESADSTLAHLEEHVRTLDDPAFRTIAHSCRSHLSLIEKKVSFGPGLTGFNKVRNEDAIFNLIEIPAITFCRVLIAEGSDAGLQEAEHVLQEFLRICRTQHSTFHTVFILPLLALNYEKQGRPDKALTFLEEAVNLAVPGDFIRPFVDPGAELIPILKRLAKKNIAANFIRQILGLLEPLKDAGSVIKAILESTEDIAIFALDKEYRYLAFNHAHADKIMRLHGAKLWVGMDFWEVTEGERDHKKSLQANCQRALKGERFIVTEQREISGDYFWYQSNYNPIYNEGGEVIGFTCFVMNITERYQLMEQLKGAKDLAESANRAKSAFLANMSHELRTPLNAILGFSQLLSRKQNATSEERESLSIINRSGRHLLDMINDVLDISKIEAGSIERKEEEFDLVALIKEISAMIQSRASEKGLLMAMETGSVGFPYVKTDVGKLRQILINLMNNAVKFTDEGCVTVRGFTEVRPEKSNQCHIVIEVEDTGLGIDPEKQEAIFEPFVRNHDEPERKGTGLGLAICKRFAELMGGSIDVKSQEGKGALFRVRLPAEIVDATAVKSPGAEEPRVIGLAPLQKPKQVLIADDNRENLLLLKSLLEEVGFHVLEAENGREAVEAFKKESPDFIWMDMRMPVMDGYEAARQIRQHSGGGSVPICAITASAFREQRPDILGAGCDEVVYKPFREHEIFEVMSRFLNIAYVYEKEHRTAPERAPETELIAMLADIPHALLGELEAATLALDREASLEVISGIAEKAPDLAAGLKSFVDNFQMAELRDLLEKMAES